MLKSLQLMESQIKNLSSLEKLKKLKKLDLRDNDIKEFPEKFLKQFEKLEELYLLGNPIENIPREVFNTQGNCLKELKEYFSKTKNEEQLYSKIQSHFNKAQEYFKQSKIDEADLECLKGLELYRDLNTLNPERLSPNIAENLNTLGFLYYDNKKYTKAKETYLEAIAIFRNLIKNNQEEEYLLELSISIDNLGIVYYDEEDFLKAKQAYKEAVDIRVELLKSNPKNAFYKSNLANSCVKLGSVYSVLKELEKALTAFNRYNQLMQELHKSHPQNAAYENDLLVSYKLVGETYFSLNHLNEALSHFESYNQTAKQLCEKYPSQKVFKNDLANSYRHLGETYGLLQHLDKALLAFVSFNELQKTFYEESPTNTFHKENLSYSYLQLGHVYSSLSDLEKTLSAFENYNELTREIYKSNLNNITYKNSLSTSYKKLGEIHTVLGDFKKALYFFQNYNQIQSEFYHDYPNEKSFWSNLLDSYEKLAETYISLEKFDEAKKVIENGALFATTSSYIHKLARKIYSREKAKPLLTYHKEYIRKLLSKGELGKAINELLVATSQNGQKDLQSNLILLSGQYHNNEQDYHRGLLERENYQRANARISYAMTSYLDEYQPMITHRPYSDDIGIPNSRIEQKHYGSGDNIGGNKVVNHYPSSGASKPPSTKNKILFIAATPTYVGKLQAEKEHRIIKDAMRRGKHRDKYEFLLPLLSVTIQELIQSVNDKPQILHFSGHGVNNGIIITTENNKTLLLPIRLLKRLFKRLKNHTKVVLLSNCYLASQAKEISEFGMYVVGYNLPIGDLAGIGFAQGLYIGLGEGKHFEKPFEKVFDEAFDDAMIVLETQSPDYADSVEVWKDGEQLDI